jgi:mannosyltransferase OCH1-like enzyme
MRCTDCIAMPMLILGMHQVDIARVAIIYLEGGMYLDTDMDLGPRTFSRDELLDRETCFLVHDADGALQNHFFRAPKRHEFIRHVLHVLKVNALEEPVRCLPPCRPPTLVD